MLFPFALGILVEDRSGQEPAPIALCALACALSWGGFACVRGNVARSLRGAAEQTLGVALGALALACRLASPVPAVTEAAAPLRVLEPPQRDGLRCSLAIWVGGPKPGRADWLTSGPACSWLPGQLALARLELRPLATRVNPGGGDPRRTAARRGVHVRARAIDDVVAAVHAEPRSVSAQLERVRRELGEVLDPRAQPTRAGATLRALITGDRTRLSAEVVDAFVRSGTAHLLAVSGLNVTFVFLITQFGVEQLLVRSRRLGVLRRVRAISLWTACAIATLYCAVAGFGVPALRAAAMSAAGSMALLGGRAEARWNALAAAALFVLALDPASLFSAAFVLSFSAVAGLLLWQPPAQGIASTLHCTLAAGLATAPWAAALGLPLPAASLAANLVAVPWFSALVALGLAIALLGLACPPLAPALRAVGRVATELGLRFVESATSVDLLAHAAHPLAASLAVCSGTFALRLVFRSQHKAAVAAALLAGTATLALAFWPDAAPRGSGVHFFSVGHGDAVLVYSGERAWLVDAGPRSGSFDAGRSVVVPALRASGVRALDVLLVTHSDLDHVGGARAVLRALPVRELWMSVETAASPALRPLLHSAAERGVRLRLVGAGERARLGELALELLGPPRAHAAASPNEGSLVLRVRGAGGCALLPGDAPRSVERALVSELAPCAVLKLAHHGSRTSSDAGFVARLDPVLAIASAGRRARSSLPHPEVRATLAERSVVLYETLRSGAIDVRFSPLGPVVVPFVAGSPE
jgi:competence protein ComEC